MKKDLTEKHAAIAYAKAWNKLDCSDFVKLLADDARYVSQYVLDEITDKQGITDYLTGKFNAFRTGDLSVTADIGVTRAGDPGRDCTILNQGGNEAVVMFVIEDEKIKRFDLCMPELMNAEKSGLHPL